MTTATACVQRDRSMLTGGPDAVDRRIFGELGASRVDVLRIVILGRHRHRTDAVTGMRLAT